MEARMRADNGRRVVLVVEDDPLIRSDIVSELDWQGWQVIDTGRAEAALEVINTGQIDVLVTDIDLGGSLSGWDLGEAVRRAECDRRLGSATRKRQPPLGNVPSHQLVDDLV
jgi:CheY-like chemotaxis protein